VGISEPTAPFRKRTILVADDDLIFRTVSSGLVLSWGYECITASDGEAALGILTKGPAPTIAVLDWLMPKLTGTEICQRVRSSAKRQYVYFILVSARDGREDSIEGLRSGADTYISKPLDAEELHAKLEIADRILGMEESLRDANAETELFTNSVPSILIGTDFEGHIGRWNLAASSVFGVEKDAALQRSTDSPFWRWWEDSGLRTSILEVVKTGQSARETLPFTRENSQRLVGLTIHPLRSHLGTISGTIIIGSDVTDKRILEDQLRQAQKLEAIGQLAAGIAHEINTPAQFVSDNVTFLKESWLALSPLLTGIQNLKQGENGWSTICEIARGADLPYLVAEVPKALDETLDGLQRIKKIVRAMKEFSHPSTNQKQHTDINAAILTTITVSRNEWKYVADLETDLDPTLPLVPCLADQVNQALLNIIVNAAHAIVEALGDAPATKGRITIRTRHDEEAVEIVISDTGAGLPEQIRARVFEPFFSTKQVGKGTGQGLALTHTIIVKEHKGRIWFESEIGRGTTFFIRLPLKVKAENREASAAVP
jgi:two-component system NtrC family sensor kinase